MSEGGGIFGFLILDVGLSEGVNGGKWPYFVPRWRDFEGFSLRSKIKEGLEGRGGGFRLSK